MVPTNDINHTGKATLVLINGLGMPVARKVTIQYANKDVKAGISLQYVIKGNRKATATYFTNRLVVFSGWVDVAGVMGEDNSGEWLSFDEQAFDKIIANVSADQVYMQ